MSSVVKSGYRLVQFEAIILVSFTIIMVACQQEDLIGHGPLTLSPDVARAFEKEYQQGAGQGNPLVFAVSTDGTKAYWYTGQAAHTPDATQQYRAIQNCETRTRKCKIYAIAPNVVWKGPVTVGRKRHQPNVSKGNENTTTQGSFCYYEKAGSLTEDSANICLGKGGTPVDDQDADIIAKSLSSGGRIDQPIEEVEPDRAEIEIHLIDLKKLYDDGLITKSVYEKKMDKILEDF